MALNPYFSYPDGKSGKKVNFTHLGKPKQMSKMAIFVGWSPHTAFRDPWILANDIHLTLAGVKVGVKGQGLV